MICTLTIVRYPPWLGWAGFLSMAIFRFPLWFNTSVSFSKLLGCGKNGSFDKSPDWRQWGVLLVHDEYIKVNDLKEPFAATDVLPSFFQTWWKFFNCEVWTLLLQPIEGHGTWDGKKCFGALPRQSDFEGMICILTRATIRLNKLNAFWKEVNPVAEKMQKADGFVTSVGIGEVPWIKQATFSVWESREQMKQFAYRMQAHATVIRKTREENWYSEDMFVRFRILASSGTLHAENPLKRKL